MNGLHQLLSADLAYRLGWTLVHSLWQGAAVAGVFGLSLLIIPRARTNARYVTGCLSLLAVVLSCAITFVIIDPAGDVVQSPPPAIERAADVSHSTTAAPAIVLPSEDPMVVALPDPPGSTVAEARPEAEGPSIAAPAEPWRDRVVEFGRVRLTPLLPWLAWPWLVGVLVLSIWRFGGLVATYRLRTIATAPVCEEICVLVRRLAERLRVSRPVRVLQSAVLATPAVIGHLRPVILLPLSALTGLSREEIEAIIAHELAHIRRHDYLVNILQTAVETLLFHHPAVWWISRRVRGERENCCDDLALAVCADCLTYARALAQIEQLKSSGAGLAAAATGGSLLGRIRRIVESAGRGRDQSSRWLAGVVTITIVVASAIGLHMAASASRQSLTPHASAAQPTTARPEAQEAIQRLSSPDSDAKARETAAETLGRVGDTSAVEVLIAALKDEDVGVRKAAAGALGRIRDPRALDPLIEASRDRKFESFKDALSALGEIGGQRAQEALLEALREDDHEYSRSFAARALERSGWKPANREQRIRYLLAMGRWDEAVAAGPTAKPADNAANQAEGAFELDIPIVIALKKGDEGRGGFPRHLVAQFKVVEKRLQAVLDVGFSSSPRIKWLMSIDVLDAAGNVLGQATATHVTSGAIARIAFLEREQINLRFARDVDLTKAARFRFRAESVSTDRGNPVVFDEELPLELRLGTYENSNTVETKWIRFERSKDRFWASVRVRWLSWPKAKYRVKVEIPGSENRLLAHAEQVIESAGVIEGGRASVSEETLRFDLGSTEVLEETTELVRYAVWLERLDSPSQAATRPSPQFQRFDWPKGNLSLDVRVRREDGSPVGRLAVTIWRKATAQEQAKIEEEHLDPIWWDAMSPGWRVLYWRDQQTGTIWIPSQPRLAEGETVVPDLPAGDYGVMAASWLGDPTPAGVSGIVHLNSREEIEDVVVDLRAGRPFAIRVVSDRDRKPIDSACCVLCRADGMPIGFTQHEGSQRTDESGTFRYAALPPGKYFMHVRREAYMYGELLHATPAGGAPLEVKADGPGEIEVPVPAFEISSEEAHKKWPWVAEGIVTDANGRPLADVEVVANCSIGTLYRTGRTTSGPDGRYILRFGPGMRTRDEKTDEWVAALQYARIAAYKDGYAERSGSSQGDLFMALEPPPKDNALGAIPEKTVLPDKPFHLDFVMLPGTTQPAPPREKEKTPGASAADTGTVQERGAEILRKMAEVNRYWLIRPPTSVHNYTYDFKLQDQPARSVTVRDPERQSGTILQGITYSTGIHVLAREPQAVVVTEVERAQDVIRLRFELKESRAGSLGNGISNAWVGYTAVLCEKGLLTLDAVKMVPLKLESTGMQELFSDYADAGDGHYVPLRIQVAMEKMQFDWRFRLHQPGLWLFDRSRYGLRMVAQTSNVKVNSRPAQVTRAEVAAQAAMEEAAETERLARLAEGRKRVEAVVSANRTWLAPPLEPRRNLAYQYRSEPPYTERVIFDDKGNVLVQLDATKENPSSPTRQCLYQPNGIKVTGDYGQPFVKEEQLAFAPGLTGESLLHQVRQVNDLARGLALDCALTRMAREPSTFQAEVQSGKDDQTYRLVLRTSDRDDSIFTGTMLGFTSWAYMHDVRYARSEIVCDAKTHRPLTEDDYDDKDALVASYVFSDWLDDAAGPAPGRIHAVVPYAKDDKDQSLVMDASFELTRPGVWLLKRCHSEFRGGMGGSTGEVSVLPTTADSFKPVADLLVRLEATRQAMREAQAAREGESTVAIELGKTTPTWTKAVWEDPKAKPDAAEIIAVKKAMLEKGEKGELRARLQVFSTGYWKEYETTIETELRDRQDRLLAKATATRSIRAEGVPSLTEVICSYRDAQGEESRGLLPAKLVIKASIGRLAGMYHGHGMWLLLGDEEAREKKANKDSRRAWGPEQAMSEPDTTRAGDIQTAWASLTPDGQPEWLWLQYNKPVVPRMVKIYETYNPGAVNAIGILGPDGQEVRVWSGKDPVKLDKGMGVSEIPIKTDVTTSRVKIYLDSPGVPGWNEIDAVGLVDKSGKVQWAVGAQASSTYAEPGGQSVPGPAPAPVLPALPSTRPAKDTTERLEELTGLASSGDRRTREKAVEDIGKLRHPLGVPVLIKALSDSEWTVRMHAAGALREIPDSLAVGPLSKALAKDNSTQVRIRAAWTLATIGGDGVVESLVRGLQDDDAEVRKSVAAALDKVAWKPDSEIDRLRYLVAAQKWDEAAGIAQKAKPVGAGKGQAEGALQFDRPILVSLEAPIGDSGYKAETEWIEFSREGGQLQAKLSVSFPSGPKAKWRVNLRLLDSDGRRLRGAQATFENSGIILGIPMGMHEMLRFSFGSAGELAAATRFRVSLVESRGDEELATRSANPDNRIPLNLPGGVSSSASLEGTVFLPDGKPAAGAELILVPPGKMAWLHEGRFAKFDGHVEVSTASRCVIETDGKGHFAFAPDLKGYVVIALHDAGVAHAPIVELARTHRIDLEAWGRIEGTLLKGGTPAIGTLTEQRAYVVGGRGHDVWLEGASNVNHNWSAKPTSDGRFAVERVVPGFVSGRGGLAELYCGDAWMIFEVKPGQTTHLTPQTRRTITGQIVPWPGSDLKLDGLHRQVTLTRVYSYPPIGLFEADHKLYAESVQKMVAFKKQAEGEPYADPPQPDPSTVKFSPDGSFAIENVLPGEYTLLVNFYPDAADRGVHKNPAIAFARCLIHAPVVPESEQNRPIDVGRFLIYPVQKEEKGDAAPIKPPPAPVGKLIWGEPQDGLTAAVEFTTGDRTYSPGELIGVRFWVENTSDRSIRVTADTGRDDPAEITGVDGRSVPVWNEPWHAIAQPVDVELGPGKRACLGESCLDTRVHRGEGELSVFTRQPNRFQAGSGVYRVRYTLYLPDLRRTPDGLQIDARRPDAWRGTVRTGWHQLLIGPASAVSRPEAVSGPDSRPAAEAKLDFLSGVPEFHSLDLSITEDALKELARKHNLTVQMTEGNGDRTYHLFRSDGENVIVMFRGGKCSGVQRMRKDPGFSAKPATQPAEAAPIRMEGRWPEEAEADPTGGRTRIKAAAQAGNSMLDIRGFEFIIHKGGPRVDVDFQFRDGKTVNGALFEMTLLGKNKEILGTQRVLELRNREMPLFISGPARMGGDDPPNRSGKAECYFRDVLPADINSYRLVVSEPDMAGLIQLLDEKDTYPREAAARALGQIGASAQAAVPRLTQMLDDPESYPRDAARKALQRIGEGRTKAAAPAESPATRPADNAAPASRSAADSALEELFKHGFLTCQEARRIIRAEQVPELYPLLERLTFSDAGRSLARAMGYVTKDQQAVRALLAYAKRTYDRYAFESIGLIGGGLADKILRVAFNGRATEEMMREWSKEESELLSGWTIPDFAAKDVHRSAAVGLVLTRNPVNIAMVKAAYEKEKVYPPDWKEKGLYPVDFNMMTTAMAVNDIIAEKGVEYYLKNLDSGTHRLSMLSPYLARYASDPPGSPPRATKQTTTRPVGNAAPGAGRANQ